MSLFAVVINAVAVVDDAIPSAAVGFVVPSVTDTIVRFMGTDFLPPLPEMLTVTKGGRESYV